MEEISFFIIIFHTIYPNRVNQKNFDVQYLGKSQKNCF